MDIEIRRFQPKDQKQIFNLITSVLKDEFDIDAKTYPETDLSNIQSSYGGKRDIFLVAIYHHEVIGTAAIKEDHNNTALLRRIFVTPEFRGTGLGRKLILKAIDFCQENGYRIIVFRSTNKMIAANNLCQKNGFKLRASIELGPIKVMKLTRRLRTHNRDKSRK